MKQLPTQIYDNYELKVVNGTENINCFWPHGESLAELGDEFEDRNGRSCVVVEVLEIGEIGTWPTQHVTLQVI